MIFKNLVLQALGTIRFWFLQKSTKKISCLCAFKVSGSVLPQQFQNKNGLTWKDSSRMQEVEEMVEEADVNNDGQVTYTSPHL